MTSQVRPLPGNTDHSPALSTVFVSIGSRRADIHDGPALITSATTRPDTRLQTIRTVANAPSSLLAEGVPTGWLGARIGAAAADLSGPLKVLGIREDLFDELIYRCLGVVMSLGIFVQIVEAIIRVPPALLDRDGSNIELINCCSTRTPTGEA